MRNNLKYFINGKPLKKYCLEYNLSYPMIITYHRRHPKISFYDILLFYKDKKKKSKNKNYKRCLKCSERDCYGCPYCVLKGERDV